MRISCTELQSLMRWCPVWWPAHHESCPLAPQSHDAPRSLGKCSEIGKENDWLARMRSENPDNRNEVKELQPNLLKLD
jgi:SET domain-containing protein